MLGLELVGNNGPWSFQAEYFGSWLYDGVTTDLGPLETNGFQPAPGTPIGTVFYQGGYAEVLYFLTGESRSFSMLLWLSQGWPCPCQTCTYRTPRSTSRRAMSSCRP
jgi:hypothetical protein